MNKYSDYTYSDIMSVVLSNCPYPCTNNYYKCQATFWKDCKKHLERCENKNYYKKVKDEKKRKKCMQFYVNDLPYYNEDCIFESQCWVCNTEDCPKTWNKYKVCSDQNPRECLMLKEICEKDFTKDNKEK